ncbi:virion structural protein [Ralstonia phage PQ43W]
MTYQVIPLQAVPNQSFGVVLDGQQALINLSTTEYGLFVDIVYNGVAVANARVCLDRTDLNPARYLGLPQFLGFVDTQGTTDPAYTGFGAAGARYLLVYGNPTNNGGTLGA